MNLVSPEIESATLSVFLHVSSFLIFAPLFSERILSPRIKIAILLVICSTLFPERLDFLTSPTCFSIPRSVVLLQSFMQGALVGVFIRGSIFVLQILGTFLSQLSSLSQILGPSVADDMSPAMGQLILFSGLFLISSYDIHLLFFEVLQEPGLICKDIEDTQRKTVEVVIQTGKNSFATAVLIAMPFSALNLVYNILLGFMNRAMPQLMVAFVGAPLLVGGFLFCLFAFLPSMMSVWIEYAISLFEMV